MACACKNTTIATEDSFIVAPENSPGCSTTLEFLNYLNNLISLNIGNTNMAQEDINLLKIYKGQVLSGINLINYCYTNYQTLETNIYNVISKYQ